MGSMRSWKAAGLACLLAMGASCSDTNGGGEGTDPREHLCPEGVTQCLALNIDVDGDAYGDGVTCVPNDDNWSADISSWPDITVHCANWSAAHRQDARLVRSPARPFRGAWLTRVRLPFSFAAPSCPAA